MLKVREFTIRKIIPEDNAALEQLVCVVLEEHGAIGEGYASSDPELLDMYTSYNQEKCIYYTLLLNGVVVGGAGIAPLKNSSSEWCELQKMYFLPIARGKGMANQMIDLCLNFATSVGFNNCYLETLNNMDKAVSLYQKFGFRKVEDRRGATGHSSCPVFMEKHW